jgi:hypothetical protein
MSRLIITARDLIFADKKRFYKLEVLHVVSVHGRGFKYSISSIGRRIAGDVHIGEDDTAYQLAVEDGKARLKKEFDELSRIFEEIREKLKP